MFTAMQLVIKLLQMMEQGAISPNMPVFLTNESGYNTHLLRTILTVGQGLVLTEDPIEEFSEDDCEVGKRVEVKIMRILAMHNMLH